MSLLLKELRQYKQVRVILSTPFYQSSIQKIHMQSTLYLNMEKMPKSFQGGKTGFTYEAGQCLAYVVKKNGHYYYVATLYARNEMTTKEKVFQDAKEIISALK